MTPADVTVAIPTYQRESVLVNTLNAITQSGAGEVLIVDQTARHEASTEERLRDLAAQGSIRWLRLDRPSIPHAMNVALVEAKRPLVLFLDDDIEPAPDLVAAHVQGFADPLTVAVVGQVLQPGESPTRAVRGYCETGLRAFLDFPFNSIEPVWVKNVMAGNLSVRRVRALEAGGFDENFVGSAYRFETEFCRRLSGGGGRVLFQPAARIRHLRAPTGGVRIHGDHLASPSPAHGVGDYYFALRHGLGIESIAYVLRRPIREVSTRFHLRRPWRIPPSLVAEGKAFIMAVRLLRRGPRLVPPQAA